MTQHRPLVAGRPLSGDGAYECAARIPMRLPGEPTRCPEIGVLRPVRRVEERREFVEVPVLRAVQPFVSVRGGLRELRCAQCGRDVGRREMCAGHGQVHARREQGIDEARRVPDEDEAGPGHRAGAVGPVAHRERTFPQFGFAQQGGGPGGHGHLVAKEAFETGLADGGRAEVAVHHSAHARDAAGQRDFPQPAVLIGLDEDIAVVRRIEMRAPGVVAVHGEVAEERIPLLHASCTRDEGVLSGRVDHERGIHVLPVCEPDTILVHALHGDALVYANAAARAVFEQDLVEPRPPDLVGVRIAPVGFREVPAPGRVVPTPGHGRAGLPDETLRLDGRQDADVVEDGEGGREQGLPDMGARKRLALVERHVETGAGEQGGGGAAGRSAAGDDYVNPRPPAGPCPIRSRWTRRWPRWSGDPPRTDP